MEKVINSRLTYHLKTMIELYGLDNAMQSIDAMLTEGIKTIDELTESIVDELYHATEFM